MARDNQSASTNNRENGSVYTNNMDGVSLYTNNLNYNRYGNRHQSYCVNTRLSIV